LLASRRAGFAWAAHLRGGHKEAVWTSKITIPTHRSSTSTTTGSMLGASPSRPWSKAITSAGRSARLRVYGGLDMFRMVATDAGSCSLENASLVRSCKLHYVFALKSTQPTLNNQASRLPGALDVSQALAFSEDHLGGQRVVIRRLFLCTKMSGLHDWEACAQCFASAARRSSMAR
jgi:hypothetical protein